MKRYVAVICVLMLLAGHIPAYATDDECIPHHSYRDVAELYTYWYNLSSVMCEERTYYLSICDYCGHEIRHYKPIRTAQHNIVLDNLAGEHLYGRNQHEYIYSCTRCSFWESVVIACPGEVTGSCVMIMSLRPEHAIE